MDVLDSSPRPPGRATAVAAALVLLAAGQAAALQRTPSLPGAVALAVPPENYFLTASADGTAVSFELRNTGGVAVRVTDVGAVVPGLVLLDTAVSGEAVGFQRVGEGADLLPAFALAPGSAVVVTLLYRVASCGAVPAEDQPVTVRSRVGRARGDVAVRLPVLPDDGPAAAPDDVVPWQTALARAQCA